MGLVAVLLVVAAAFAHAGWNFFAKRAGSGGAAFVWLGAACSAVLYLPVMAASVWWTGLPAPNVGLLAVVVSALLHVGYFVLLQRGYSVGDMSVVYPLARGTGPMLSMVIAVVLLHERPGLLGVLGGLLVVVGVFVIGLSDGVPRSAASLTGIGFGLLTGALIALYTVWDAYAVTALALPPLLFDWANNAMRALMLSPYAVRQRSAVAEIWTRYRREVLAVALLSPLAYMLVLFAMRLAPVSMVAPARELSIVLAGLLAWRVLGEAQPGRRLTGAVVVLAGVVLLGIA
ncbi:EamA-like transporter family protein [Saccharopolyspora erythraea NRRL 2338]|uniref:Possible transporter, DMT superfamily n=2 Tax=Saccharopolyspora erythraea TaxID=1836 RepID=A4F9P0_SACEN|nr:EamA family transporter [Saccharopolyspora erythraea]EQD84584.1 DMT family permease [Saccharopolyspora erythraea D]PFG94551.1 EamA-like transporter family protein [Saccharopolyspora erythraea NRRL 2338]QRK91297.1 EamA family transporter [Saccharopolyspora erythraea]CAM00765.1 possible transporter, DMT superfamily [Saccharopolyspora erythraea NRRL 2338]